MYPTKILPIFEFPHERGAFEQLFALFGGEFCPKIAVVVGGIDLRSKEGVAKKWGVLVVGTAGLTLVTPEHPPLCVEGLIASLLNGAIGDTKGCVDTPVGANCSRWAS